MTPWSSTTCLGLSSSSLPSCLKTKQDKVTHKKFRLSTIWDCTILQQRKLKFYTSSPGSILNCILLVTRVYKPRLFCVNFFFPKMLNYFFPDPIGPFPSSFLAVCEGHHRTLQCFLGAACYQVLGNNFPCGHLSFHCLALRYFSRHIF